MMILNDWVELTNDEGSVWINLSKVCNIKIVETADGMAKVYVNKENGVGNIMIVYKNRIVAEDAIRQALGMVTHGYK